jgi:hypothetical protein
MYMLLSVYLQYSFRSPHKSLQSENCPSRLCKAGFFHRFKDLAKVAQQPHLLNVVSYANAKQSSHVYQTAKHAFRRHCAQIGIGEWVAMPPEVDLFQK